MKMQTMKKKEGEEETRDGTVDYYGRPSIRSNSGQWVAGIVILRMSLFPNQNYNLTIYQIEINI
jgi:hypothetical protein